MIGPGCDALIDEVNILAGYPTIEIVAPPEVLPPRVAA